MKLNDAQRVKMLLLRIKNPTPKVAECIAIMDREIAIREAQADAGRKERRDNDSYFLEGGL